MYADFLIELYTEELPPKSLRALAENFLENVKSRLKESDLTFSDASFFATPNRLAVYVKKLISHQPDKNIERKGPSLDKAFDENKNPTPACVGFARSCGIDVSQLITLETPQGKFVGCKQHVKGKTIFEMMPALIEDALAALPIPKPMRWGSHSYKFIRPVHSVMMLYGDKIIDAVIFGCKTSNKTRGHRFLHPKEIKISSPEKYLDALKKGFVLADFNERQNKIMEEIDRVVRKKLGKNVAPMVDVRLLEEVTSIVEWPVGLLGSFDETFLNVPQPALISAMQDHQRYFPIMNLENKLLPYFVTICNIECKDEKRITSGNERVLRARLSDAAFFFETDKKIKLEDRIEKLKTIIFQNKLGTLFDKTERVKKLAALIAKKINSDVALAERAAYLSKTDLTTHLVLEFPELQGIAGYYYALLEKEPNEVALALHAQYMPRFSGDQLPDKKTSIALAIADRLDTLMGFFGINQAPTGEKDPFGLRRAALGIVRILIEKELNLDLHELLKFSENLYGSLLQNKNTVNDVLNFIQERLRFWYQEKNISADIFASVAALKITDPFDFDRRIKAVLAFKQLPEAESLSIANKRVSNILSKYEEPISASAIDSSLLGEEEKQLAHELENQSAHIQSLYKEAKYEEVLSALARLRKPVDQFFDKVLVMTDDKKQRENRLLLLKKLRELFLQVADIALLQQ